MKIFPELTSQLLSRATNTTPSPSILSPVHLFDSLPFYEENAIKEEGGGGMGGWWCTLSVQFIISAHLIIVLLFHTYCTDEIMQVAWTMAVELIYTPIIPHYFYLLTSYLRQLD